ncbi:holin protein [Staphylococcus aureus]|nr:holin protein [Staphylococcus aureus]
MDIGTIVRTILLIVAWINQFLAIKHISPIPVTTVLINTSSTGIGEICLIAKN